MAFGDEIEQLHEDCLGTFGQAGTLIIPKAGALDLGTGTRAGTPVTQAITFTVEPSFKTGRAERIRVWCRKDDVTIGNGVPAKGWQFTVNERTWTVESVTTDADGTGFRIVGEVMAQ